MKKIHIRKPDIKGLSVKVRNLKFKDIKEHYKARKERRGNGIQVQGKH